MITAANEHVNLSHDVEIGGQMVPHGIVAEYRDSSAVDDPAEWQRRLQDDG